MRDEPGKGVAARRRQSPIGAAPSALRRLRPRARVVLAGLVVALLYLYIGGGDGFYVQWKLSREIDRLERQNSLFRDQNEQLRQQIARLKGDMAYLERIARERYGMARPGERVYRVVPPPENRQKAEDE